MSRATRYELGFNWPDDRECAFTEEIRRAARRRRIQWIRVTKDQAEKFRRRVDRQQVKVGLFLNTQADGINFESPSMLLCRSLKAADCLVVEDPDDCRNYADRGLAFEYLERAGLPVPRHFVIEDWKANKRPAIGARQARLGSTWAARPAMGMSRRPPLISSSKNITSALIKGGFKPGQRVLIHRHLEPVVRDGVELRFSVWYLFGQVVPCWSPKGAGKTRIMTLRDTGFELFGRLIRLVKEIAGITRLDWFVSEVAAVKVPKGLDLFILEGANALAGLGPGANALRLIHPEVMRLAGEQLVEAAWRHAHKLPLSNGVTVRLTQ